MTNYAVSRIFLLQAIPNSSFLNVEGKKIGQNITENLKARLGVQ